MMVQQALAECRTWEVQRTLLVLSPWEAWRHMVERWTVAERWTVVERWTVLTW